MNELGKRIVGAHKLPLPDPHLIMCKASVIPEKFGEYMVGMNTERLEGLASDTYIVHVDIRTRSIRGAYLYDLMDKDIKIVKHSTLGSLIYWSCFKFKELADLTENDFNQMLDLRLETKSPNQIRLF